MLKNELISRYEQAAAILPSRLRKAALALSNEEKAAAEELRLRAGRPLTVLLPAGELPLEAEVEPEELETLCDIATEFSEMITTQRGYQANTRIITVTDSMLEELVNMKR